MAENPADNQKGQSSNLNQDLGDLQPIEEIATDSATQASTQNQVNALDFGSSQQPQQQDTGIIISPDRILRQDSWARSEAVRHSNPPRASTNRQPTFTDGPSGHSFQRNETSGTNFSNQTKYSETFDETRVWDQKAILSLDGGGIRGYSALLILRELMTKIGQEEKNWAPGDNDCDGPAASSFYPIPPAPCMATDTDSCNSVALEMAQTTDSSPWLPCHYFDYMAGTSTGGLISIMLGRLRMNVDDCITEYRSLGKTVFGEARYFHLRNIPPCWYPREKYKHRVLEKVIIRLVNDKVPKISGYPGGKTFAFDENRCRVVVVAYQQQQKDDLPEHPYLFRTYENYHKGNASERPFDRNLGPAHNIPIWQVARATSAAPSYFKEVKIEGLKYLDGGFGANNPCVELYREVRKMNNDNADCAKCVISIGTGKSKKKRIRDSSGMTDFLLGHGLSKFIRYSNFARKWAADSERAHEDMVYNRNQVENRFQYYRWNVEEGLDRMKLDEWRCRGRLRTSVGRSIGWLKFKCSLGDSGDQEIEKPSETTAQETGQTNRDAAANGTPHQVNPNKRDEESRIPQWFRNRNKTLQTIENSTAVYLQKPEVQRELEESAKYLVRNRRDRVRADKQRWQRTCFGTWYQCRVIGCPRGEKKYPDSHAIKKHLLEKHHQLHSTLNAAEKERWLERTLEEYKIVVH